MSILTSHTRRIVAASVATMVGGTTLVLAASAPSQAAPITDTLTWGVNEQYFDHLSTRTVTGGVTVDTETKTFTFPRKSATIDNGTYTFNYGGSVKGAFVMGPTEYYSVTVADPSVTVRPDGDAVLSATVSSANAESGQAPAASVSPVRVKVLEVPVTGSTEFGWNAAASQDFAEDLFNGLVPGVQGHFRQTSETEQPKKRPAGFWAGTSPAVGVKTTTVGTRTTVSYQTGNFVGGDANFQGVYVGIAPSGSLPDVSSREGMEAFIDAHAYGAFPGATGAITDGAFSGSFSVDLTALKPGVAYSLYTWQGHQHTSTALDTETALSIKYTGATTPDPVVKAKAKTKAKWVKKPTAKKAGKVKVTIAKAKNKAKATGKVKVTIKIAGKKKAKKITAKVKNGKATFKAPKGTKKVTIKYTGDKNYKKASKKLKR